MLTGKIRLVRKITLVMVLVLAAGLWGCAGDPFPDPTQAAAPARESPVEGESSLPVAAEPASEAESEKGPAEELASEANVEAGEPGADDAAGLPSAGVVADVTAVSASGEAGAYQFSVTIRSPDTGCEQYADWWEVLDEDGNLLYRRILTHSHAGEQPFTRSGGPVPIEADRVVIIRAHMHPYSYGVTVFKGTVEDGFVETILAQSFAIDLETVEPLPTSCAF